MILFIERSFLKCFPSKRSNELAWSHNLFSTLQWFFFFFNKQKNLSFSLSLSCSFKLLRSTYSYTYVMNSSLFFSAITYYVFLFFQTTRLPFFVFLWCLSSVFLYDCYLPVFKLSFHDKDWGPTFRFKKTIIYCIIFSDKSRKTCLFKIV